MYLTEATLLKAFYKSINTPVIELGQKLGFKNILEYAKKLGINTPIKQEAGSLLGSSEVTMMDMAQLYGTIANQGKRVDTIAIRRITDREGNEIYKAPSVKERSKQVISPQVAYLMTEGMRAVLKYGTAYSQHAMATYTVGKTGTSDLAKDNWFCGFSRNLVAITWMGTDDPKGFINGISAAKTALPVWAEFMKKVSQINMPEPIEPPADIHSAAVNPHYGNLDPAGLTMYFIDGNLPTKKDSNIKAIKQSRNFRNVFDR
jgi:penicillin-binding protein 1A